MSEQEKTKGDASPAKDAGSPAWLRSAEFHGHHYVRFAKGFVFIAIAMPLLCFILLMLSALVIGAQEDCKFVASFQTMAAAFTGGALLLDDQSCTLTTTVGKLVGALLGSMGIGAFGFMVAMLSNLQGWFLTKPLDRGMTWMGQGSRIIQICKLFIGTTCLTICGVFVQLVLATILAAVLVTDPAYDYPTAWRTVVWVQLGGGVPYQIEVPRKDSGRAFICLIGLWAIGMETLIVSKVSDCISNTLANHFTATNLRQSLISFLAFTFLFLPLSLSLVMVIAGSLLVAAGINLPWEACFWITLPSITGGAASVYSLNNFQFATGGIAMLIVVSSCSYFYLSICIGIGGLCLDPLVDKLGFGASDPPSIWKGVLKLMVAISVVIPVAVALASLPLGGILAAAQDWTFTEGAWWCLSAQLGGGMSLSRGDVDTRVGRFIGTLVTGFSIAVSVLTISFSGSPATEPLQKKLWFFVAPESKPSDEEVAETTKPEMTESKEEVAETTESI